MTNSKRPNSRTAWNDTSSNTNQMITSRDLEAYGNVDPDAANIGGTTGDEKQGCWSSFSGCITGIWTTRQLANSRDREVYVKTTLRELIVYVFFLAILCLLTFGMTSTNTFYYTQVLNNLFIGTPFEPNATTAFQDIGEVDDVWSFLENVLVPSLFPEQYYNGQERSDTDKNILYECKLLGMPRIRQIRVTNDSCVIPDDFKKAITVCYDNYSPDCEDKSPFGGLNGTAWTYYSETELQGSTHWGLLATYSGAGSYQDLGTSLEEASDFINYLQSNLWITRGTRVVFVDFTVYNANINLFCVIKLVMEFPATGGVIPSYSFRTVKLIRYVTIFDYFILGCEIIFCFFIIYYIVEEILEIMKNKCPYFKSVWNLLDIVVILISLVCIAFSVYRTISVNNLLRDLLNNPYQFPNFEFLGFWQTQYNNAVATAIFFAWIKIFKYISFNKTMTQLSSTLSKCSKDIGGFAIMFFIVFFAFAQLGYLLFGTQVQDYQDFGTSVFTLLRLILGDFDFHAIEQANRVLGPIFFITYVFFVFFVLLNMFLAIINDTYSDVKAEISRQKNEFEIGDYFLRGYNNFLGKMGRRDKIIDLQTSIKLADSNCDGTMSFEEIRKHLKQRNFCDTEIELFFSKYDKNADKALSVGETKKMLADLEGEKLQLDNEIDKAKIGQHNAVTQNITANSVSYEEYCVLSRRVDRMETSIGCIVNKIDAVLLKIEDLDNNKAKRRDAMTKILESIHEKEAGERNDKNNTMEKLVRDELASMDVGSTTSLPKNTLKK